MADDEELRVDSVTDLYVVTIRQIVKTTVRNKRFWNSHAKVSDEHPDKTVSAYVRSPNPIVEEDSNEIFSARVPGLNLTAVVRAVYELED